MKTFAKLAMGAVVATGLAIGAAAPAEAGVFIGVNFAPHRDHYCYYHPRACERDRGWGYNEGSYDREHGYWNDPGWHRHRGWDHGDWRRDNWNHGDWRYER